MFLKSILTSESSLLIMGLAIGLLIGPIVIKSMKKLELGQAIRQEGPKSHLEKSGTPTLGGLIIFISLIITMLIKRELNNNTIFLLTSTILFAAIGFVDDLLILLKKDNSGLSAKSKLVSQVIVALIISIFAMQRYENMLLIPFLKRFINLSVLSVIINTVMLVSLVNAVNLTDGLDGLASSVTIIVLVFFAAVSYNLNELDIYKFILILIGSLLSFLAFNKNPAKIFMGDTGSMGLGGAIGALAILTRTSLIVPIVGGIYLIEALSVIIQVYYYKKTEKRFFKMAPLHHHLEAEGWSENKVALVFSLITAGLAILSMNALF